MSKDLMSVLYQRMYDEQRKFRDWLLAQPQEEVLDHACEYTVREDILAEIGEAELSPDRAKALLRSPCPLEDVYKDWQKRDSSDHMEDLLDTIEARADHVIQTERENAGKER